MKYVCDVCGYVYDPAKGDPDNGIDPGTAFEDLPEDWTCPLCAVGKDQFTETEQDNRFMQWKARMYNPGLIFLRNHKCVVIVS